MEWLEDAEEPLRIHNITQGIHIFLIPSDPLVKSFLRSYIRDTGIGTMLLFVRILLILFAECESGWEHDSSEFQATMATTNEWFCEREDYSNHIYSLSTAGSTVGTVVLPVIADR